jgi:hypothetical protein
MCDALNEREVHGEQLIWEAKGRRVAKPERKVRDGIAQDVNSHYSSVV